MPTHTWEKSTGTTDLQQLCICMWHVSHICRRLRRATSSSCLLCVFQIDVLLPMAGKPCLMLVTTTSAQSAITSSIIANSGSGWLCVPECTVHCPNHSLFVQWFRQVCFFRNLSGVPSGEVTSRSCPVHAFTLFKQSSSSLAGAMMITVRGTVD